MKKPPSPEYAPLPSEMPSPLGAPPELIDETDAEQAEAITVKLGAASYAEKVNEDFFAADHSGNVVLCDGVGSSGHGAEAAALASKFLRGKLDELGAIDNRELAEKSLIGILDAAQMRVRAEQKMTGRDLVSTASVVKFIREDDKPYAVVGNMGDSPVYLMRDGQLSELTNYHQYLPPREERPALGRDNGAVANAFSVPIEPGDRIVVTSNGLRKNDPRMTKMEKILKTYGDPQQAADVMTKKVRGESDDTRTAVVLAS